MRRVTNLIVLCIIALLIEPHKKNLLPPLPIMPYAVYNDVMCMLPIHS